PTLSTSILFFFSLYGAHRDLHSFPTRRSSDLFNIAKRVRSETAIGENPVSVAYAAVTLAQQIFSNLKQDTVLLIGAGETIELVRSEEHTSELQSRENLVCRLLLEKKKKIESYI